MSADNWAPCPQCKKNEKPEKSKYGKVSEEEYLESIKQPKKELEATLREDYSLGINEEGQFSANWLRLCSHSRLCHRACLQGKCKC